MFMCLFLSSYLRGPQFQQELRDKARELQFCEPRRNSDSVKRHLSRRHISVLMNFLFDFISDGGCTREKEKRHLFPHGDRVKMLAQGFLDLSFDAGPHLEYFEGA